ncbi:FIG00945285: putative DNA-binding protein [[Actinomadura] parvosata subsp. kistnae]|nr:FIG00945285: putative DNA-binding protein [Actinomadura parvosata subsp. kistnae]
MFGHAGYGAGRQPAHARDSRVRGKNGDADEGTRMQELRLVAVSEDGTYLVLATAGRGTRFTLPVDDRLRAAVRGNFSRLGQYEIEVESPLRPKEIQARIRAGETAEEIAATAGIPVERVRWFEGPVLQEREYVAQQAQRVAVRMPGESAPGPTLGDLVAERLTRRGVPTDEIDWDSAKRDDGLWRVKLGYVWNGHTRHAEWLFDPRKRHVTPHDDEAMRLSSADFDPEPAVVEDTTVTPFAPRVAKLQPVPPLASSSSSSDALPFPSVVRGEPEEPPFQPSTETAYTPSREAPFDPPAREDSPAREPFRPEPPARETGYTRPGDTTSRRGGSSPWLPDFGSGRAEHDSIYAPATPPSARPDTRPRLHRPRTAPPPPRHRDPRPHTRRPGGARRSGRFSGRARRSRWSRLARRRDGSRASGRRVQVARGTGARTQGGGGRYTCAARRHGPVQLRRGRRTEPGRLVEHRRRRRAEPGRLVEHRRRCGHRAGGHGIRPDRSGPCGSRRRGGRHGACHRHEARGRRSACPATDGGKRLAAAPSDCRLPAASAGGHRRFAAGGSHRHFAAGGKHRHGGRGRRSCSATASGDRRAAAGGHHHRAAVGGRRFAASAGGGHRHGARDRHGPAAAGSDHRAAAAGSRRPAATAA